MHRVLIVDDQLDAARLLATLLQLDGFATEQIEGNWGNLVSEVEERRPDLVILDVRLPGIDGLELVRQLRSHSDPVVARVPVLLASALDHRYEGKLVGANGFLLKPYTREMLLSTIDKIRQETATG